MKKSLYTAIQWTWGFPQTLIGSALYMANIKKRHIDFNGACVTFWDRDEGISLGKFIFVPGPSEGDETGFESASGRLAEHEYGHSIQSLILGPLYLLVIGIPSFAWSRLPYFQKKRRKSGRSYYAPFFEKSANHLSASVLEKRRDRETFNLK